MTRTRAPLGQRPRRPRATERATQLTFQANHGQRLAGQKAEMEQGRRHGWPTPTRTKARPHWRAQGRRRTPRPRATIRRRPAKARARDGGAHRLLRALRTSRAPPAYCAARKTPRERMTRAWRPPKPAVLAADASVRAAGERGAAAVGRAQADECAPGKAGLQPCDRCRCWNGRWGART